MSIEKMQKGSEYMAETLHAYGITHVFLMEAILRHTLVELERLGVRRIVAHSEKGAAYMADGYARAGRKPGVCMSQSVGAANLSAGLQDAYLASSPVIAITGRKAPEFQHRHSYQELDHGPLFAAVTKYNVFASAPELVPMYLRQCFREATSGRPGPVHLDVTNHAGAFLDKCKTNFDATAEPQYARVPAMRPLPDPDAVRKLADVIRAAQRPLLVVGNGANISGAHDETRALADLGLPVASSVDGKGLLPDSHPLYLGPVGDYNRKCANDMIKRADLVVYVGCSVNDQLTLDWTLPPRGVRIAQIDISPEELGRNIPNCASVLGDAKLSMAALVQALEGWRAPTAWTAEAEAALTDWLRRHAARLTSNAVPILTDRLCQDLSDFLPQDSVVVADTGFSSIWTGAFVRFLKPGQRLIRATGGSLGWSFPASLGAKCALPDRPVFCFTGDGGFWYHLCEMETAARHNIKTITVLNNNGGFGQCAGKVRQIYAGKEGRPEDLFMFRNTNFTRIAEEMGCMGIRVEQPADIIPALEKALAADRPVLVEVITDIACDPQEQE